MAIEALKKQRRGTKAGEIRLGTRDAKGNPISLESFRLTTKWERVAERVAETFGGKPEWTRLANGEKTIEVMTETANLPVLVPPFDAFISQFREMWGNGFCARRCDSITEEKSGEPCVCPVDDFERKQLAAKGKACKDVTRLQLMLPRISTGVWKVVTGSGNAAVELSDSTDLLGAAADQGIWLPATARLDRRTEKYLIDGQTKTFKFPVLALLPDHSPEQILSGELGSGIAAALPSPTSLALESGRQNSETTALPADSRHSGDELASAFQKAEIRERVKDLLPPDRVAFDKWIANEKRAGGVHSMPELRASEVVSIIRKLDMLSGIRTPGAWEADEGPADADAEIVDAEIVEEHSA
jgi:hypothetical protein